MWKISGKFSKCLCFAWMDKLGVRKISEKSLEHLQSPRVYVVLTPNTAKRCHSALHKSPSMLSPSPTFGDGSTEDGGRKRPVQVTGKSTLQVRRKVSTQPGQLRTATLQVPPSKLWWLGWATESCHSFLINSGRLSGKSQVLWGILVSKKDHVWKKKKKRPCGRESGSVSIFWHRKGIQTHSTGPKGQE